MAAVAAHNSALTKKLVDNLQSDLRALSNEAKRKYPPVKEAAETGIVKLRNVLMKTDDIVSALVTASSEILQPFILGSDTKNMKIVQISLTSIQRLISHEVISEATANNIINMLWMLMESGTEELKLLQTITLLLTTNSLVHGDAMAKAMVMCFRLHFTKDSTTINTASATVRQLVAMVFERVLAEDCLPTSDSLEPMNTEELKVGSKNPPKSLRLYAGDAFLLFQDLCQLVNADQPYWLVGMTEMTRTFGLELVESLLTTFSHIFHKHPEFSFLLKERVCPLVIKLFSPNIKYRQGIPTPAISVPMEKPYFPITMRLLRVVSVLIQKYYSLLVTECEIFLSLVVKFLDAEKPSWQRSLALEVLHRMCIQPELLVSFCQSYDMKPHSTKIFRDIVNALGTFIHSLFVNPLLSGNSNLTPPAGNNSPQITGTPPALVGGLPVGHGMTPQPAFLYRGIWIPIINNMVAGSAKPIFMEMLDKLEPPSVPEGYGITVAYLCLLDIIKSISIVVEGIKDNIENADQSKPAVTSFDNSSKNYALHSELINSSWCGLLAALSLLLDASTGETATENILKSMQTYASLCGLLNMTTPRDAFITSLCKASLPPHYALTILNTNSNKEPAYKVSHMRSNSQEMISVPSYTGEGDVRNQVVAVGTPLPTASLPLGAQQGPVVLTAKNLQCMRTILSLAHCHGGILGTAWHLVLTTLQHLVWILGLKPSTGGSFKAGRANDGPNAVITTAVMADLPVLSAMLSRLFESSQYLDDVALHHLIDALCKLSQESMEMAYSNREPSLFAVAKLLETGLVNLPRVEVLWRPVTAHLLEVCQHPHIRMREWGAEAVTYLVKTALAHKYDPLLHQNLKLQTLLLSPLQELSVIPHPDIRQKQLECVLHVLHSNGETLAHGWPLILEVIGAVSNNQGESLIRIAFQCLQLVVTDFLPVMPCIYLQVCVEVAAHFGSQDQELNISLTAIGLLWNISDYFYQNRDKIKVELSQDIDKDQSKSNMPAFDALWMCLFSKLGDLCVDPRPAVRKSAGQTLFSTISAHSIVLEKPTWQAVLWQVLFPLLDKVKTLSGSASSDKVNDMGGGNILIHHSRDTAQKQWAETRVLTLSGVARVFSTERETLQGLGDFPRAWALFLEFVELAALCRNTEVSLAALKSFQEILQIRMAGDNRSEEWQILLSRHDGKETTQPKIKQTIDTNIPASLPSLSNGTIEDATLWTIAWKIWYNIGINSTAPPDTKDPQMVYIPSQPFLTALVQIFPYLFQHIKYRFVAADLQKLSSVLKNTIAIPVHGEATPFIVPSITDFTLTPLQEAVLQALDVLQKEVLSGSETLQTMIPSLFDQLLMFSEYACQPPVFGKLDIKNVMNVRPVTVDWVAMNYVPFAEKAMEMVIELYRQTATYQPVIQAHVLQNIIKVLKVPLSLKYSCPSQSSWKLSMHTLLAVLSVGLPIARQMDAEFQGMWSELASAFEEFLFTHSLPPSTQSIEDFQRDEALDCKVIQIIREDILPYSACVPKEFVVKLMSLLNKGSIHSVTTGQSFIESDTGQKLREEFAKFCFETLLQFSFISKKISTEEGAITKLALTTLLHRFQEILEKYVLDERLSGKCPLPRHRMSEISFVLKAAGTLLVSLKKVPPGTVDRNIWIQVVNLYPLLVECVTSTSSQVCSALKEVLQEYRDLLVPPGNLQNGI